MERRAIASIPSSEEPLWYKDAVIYEVHVRAFYDSDGDGVGDFSGLVQKLDYLEDLGITALWLLPFYPSPLRDDGYDISDYNSIQPVFGSMDGFKNLGFACIRADVLNMAYHGRLECSVFPS